MYDNCIFKSVCMLGHKDLAQWLYNISKTDNNTRINIHTDDEFTFIATCASGHKDLAEWLYNLSKI